MCRGLIETASALVPKTRANPAAKTAIRSFVCIALALPLVACPALFGDPAAKSDDSPPRDESVERTLEVISAVSVQQLQADPATSRVRFAVTKATGGHMAHFERFAAFAKVKGDQVSLVRVEIEVPSLVADVPDFAEHVLTNDFLDAEKYPKSAFVTTSITEKADGAHTHRFEGTFVLRGVTQKLGFPATVRFAPDRVVADATVPVSLRALGIENSIILNEMVDDAVELDIHLEMPR
jgi:polyisoprenoid-binding protein YceI